MPKQTGVAELWLVRGSVPHYREMVKLARAVSEALVDEYGTFEFIKRLSNPLWFSCYACTLGFEFNTSGQTTVVLKALRDALSRQDIGVKVVGGKGKLGRAVPQELVKVGDEFGMSTSKIEGLKYASKISTKVDSSALQDLSGQIYCHAVVVDENGRWAVCQQKMDTARRIARRYHWLCDLKSYMEEPHSGIIGDRKQRLVLDLTARKSDETRATIKDVVNDIKPQRLQAMLTTIQKPREQKNLLQFIKKSTQKVKVIKLPTYLTIPKRFNLNVLNKIYQTKVPNFEQLLATKGVGPSTVRGLAFISNLIYGTEASWKDPAAYTWSFGSKSGRPYYVQKQTMLDAAEVLKQAVEEARLANKEKLAAIARLKDFLKI